MTAAVSLESQPPKYPFLQVESATSMPPKQFKLLIIVMNAKYLGTFLGPCDGGGGENKLSWNNMLKLSRLDAQLGDLLVKGV